MLLLLFYMRQILILVALIVFSYGQQSLPSPRSLDEATINSISLAMESSRCRDGQNADNQSIQIITESRLAQFTTWAKMVDNSYCVGATGSIQSPFVCDAWCSDYPQVELILKWSGEGTFAASGFLALDHATQTVFVIIRGTRSLRDIITDLRVRSKNLKTKLQRRLPDVASKLQDQCPDCEVHSGFLSAFLQSYKQVQPVLYPLLADNANYKLFVGGHSLGGAIALLYGLTLKLQGFDPLVYSMAQPRVGNQAFANFLDVLFFGQCNPTTLDVSDDSRRLYRLTHFEDPVPRVPVWGDYSHTSGEIFIKDESGLNPSVDQVWACNGQNNVNGVATGEIKVTALTMKANHNHYLIRMSQKCGATLKEWYNGGTP